MWVCNGVGPPVSSYLPLRWASVPWPDPFANSGIFRIVSVFFDGRARYRVVSFSIMIRNADSKGRRLVSVFSVFSTFERFVDFMGSLCIFSDSTFMATRKFGGAKSRLVFSRLLLSLLLFSNVLLVFRRRMDVKVGVDVVGVGSFFVVVAHVYGGVVCRVCR